MVFPLEDVNGFFGQCTGLKPVLHCMTGTVFESEAKINTINSD
jgi:hypothetical protein